jgi:hypothetical protein
MVAVLSTLMLIYYIRQDSISSHQITINRFILINNKLITTLVLEWLGTLKLSISPSGIDEAGTITRPGTYEYVHDLLQGCTQLSLY